jgi:nucleotide-binding universal stress UspA family protein
MKLLLAVDGSEHSQRAAQYVRQLAQTCPGPHTLFLVNVQEYPDAPELLSHMTEEKIEAFARRRGEELLHSFDPIWKGTSLTVVPTVLVGERVAETLVDFALRHQCDQIVMGTRGQGALYGALLGSVSHQVLEKTSLPVTLIK